MPMALHDVGSILGPYTMCTIKGTCGFLGLPRLGSLAHAAETLMGRFRDGAQVQPEAVDLVMRSIDRIKQIVSDLENNDGNEPERR